REGYQYKILAAETIPYSAKWKKVLQQAFHFTALELQELSIEYGSFLSDYILNFIAENNLKRVDFIASHGHTIHHRPEKGYTLQIGDGNTIFKKIRIKTICDFRSQDVDFGGQGAPLVPIGDLLLFTDYDYCLNLGGFANISFDKNGKRLAFDICSVNIVLNHFANKIGLDYDDKGLLAEKGELNISLLKELNTLEFYQSKQPKSLGVEFVLTEIFPILNNYSLDVQAVLRTYVEHIAIQIAAKIDNDKSVLITGGGAFNDFLIKRIAFHSKASFVIPDKKLINYKEALIFAFLGLRRLENKVNCLKTVTGAKQDHCSGMMYG
ncbi:MAG TPA: anhydro-N-acetylmuramic acid kinase, partial [Flavobacteriia bacterium]|nr:anhydro-N-acetylmuramic acid kinase [Flavobacteriia bacterium]